MLGWIKKIRKYDNLARELKLSNRDVGDLRKSQAEYRERLKRAKEQVSNLRHQLEGYQAIVKEITNITSNHTKLSDSSVEDLVKEGNLVGAIQKTLTYEVR